MIDWTVLAGTDDAALPTCAAIRAALPDLIALALLGKLDGDALELEHLPWCESCGGAFRTLLPLETASLQPSTAVDDAQPPVRRLLSAEDSTRLAGLSLLWSTAAEIGERQGEPSEAASGALMAARCEFVLWNLAEAEILAGLALQTAIEAGDLPEIEAGASALISALQAAAAAAPTRRPDVRLAAAARFEVVQAPSLLLVGSTLELWVGVRTRAALAPGAMVEIVSNIPPEQDWLPREGVLARIELPGPDDPSYDDLLSPNGLLVHAPVPLGADEPQRVREQLRRQDGVREQESELEWTVPSGWLRVQLTRDSELPSS